MTVSVLTAACGGPEIACRYVHHARRRAPPSAGPLAPQAAFVATAGVSYFIRVASCRRSRELPPHDHSARPAAGERQLRERAAGDDGDQWSLQQRRRHPGRHRLVHGGAFRRSFETSGSPTPPRRPARPRSPRTGPRIQAQIAIFTGCGGTELACNLSSPATVALPVTPGRPT